MHITEVKVFPVEEEKLKAYVTITFDDCFIVRDLKIIRGKTGMFVAMPSKKTRDGSFKDIAHPLNSDTRQSIEQVILDAYEQEVGLGSSPTHSPSSHLLMERTELELS